jgi:protocatechuate 4,5-dioxygenase alpha chain
MNREYRDIPGTYVMDGQHCRKGYHLNMFCMSLNKADNRDEFRQDEAAYLNKLKLSDEQKKAVLERDWLGMLQLGGNIYYTFKLAIFDGRSMQFVGGAMSDVSEEEFRQMMVSGGRPVEGNRSKKEQEQSNG